MPKNTPGPDDIVMARRKAGFGDVTVASDLSARLPGFELSDGIWREGGSIPMRYQEALEREDCEPEPAKGQEG